MSKKACKSNKTLEKEEAKFKCSKCGEFAKKKEKVCKPMKLK